MRHGSKVNMYPNATQNLHTRLKPLLLATEIRQNILKEKTFVDYRALMALVTDVLSGAVLQPLMDVLPNPDIVNLLIELGFSPDPTKKFGPPSGQRVEYLERFVMANHTASQSALQVYYYSSCQKSSGMPGILVYS